MQSLKRKSVPSCSSPQKPICSKVQRRILFGSGAPFPEGPARFAFLGLLLVGALLSAASLQGQTVTFSGTAVNFGNVDVCAPGKVTPAPCRATLTLNYKVTGGGTLGTPKVLTLGAPNLDFTLAGGTCTGRVTAGSSCNVLATLSPRFPGLRAGAVQITDGKGDVLATTFLHGVGLAPQIVVAGSASITLFSHPNSNIPWGGPALDGAGNVFVTNGERSYDGAAVFELPAGGGAVRTVGTEFDTPVGVAVDGAGDLFVTEYERNTVVEVPAGCANIGCQINLDGGFELPYGIAVDGAGNVYVANPGHRDVVEMPAGCSNLKCALTVGSGFFSAEAVAVDGAGNLFIGDTGNFRVVKVPAGGGAQSVVASDLPLSFGLAVDVAGDLLITDSAHGLILEVPAGSGGALTTLYSGLLEPAGVALDGAGNVFYTGAGSNIALSKIQRSPVPAYTFATTAVGTVSSDSPQAYTVENSGNAVLSLTGLMVGTDSNFIQGDGPGTPADCAVSLSLAPGARCDLSINFMPTVNGPLTGAAVLTDNALNATNATQVILLSGIGGSTGPISFPNGFSSAPSGLVLNGGVSIIDKVLQLTDGGSYEDRSVFSATRIGLASFQTSFDFQLTGKDALAPDADGFTFVVQPNGPDALGSDGGGLGYGPPSQGQPGAAITNSVAIKFDLHNNDGEGSSSTGLYIYGQAPTVPSLSTLSNGIDFHSGHVFHVVLVYDGGVLTLTITDQTTQAVFGDFFPVDIAGILGGSTGYAGFTASTGMKTAVQSILNWELTSSACCTAGEPGFPAGFSAPSDLTLNGSAEISNGALELVQDTAFETGSAFYSTAIPVNGFTSDFDFKLSRGYGDGFTFVVQSEGLHAIGSPGGGLGYGPATPGGGGNRITHSVAVKFDLHSDAGEGSNSTGVYIDGASPTSPYVDLAPIVNLHRGHSFHVHLLYSGGFLTLRITDLTQYAMFAGLYKVDIRKVVGTANAYAGFTAATGDLYDSVKILNWSMTSY
jgi:Legume lectin domain